MSFVKVKNNDESIQENRGGKMINKTLKAFIKVIAKVAVAIAILLVVIFAGQTAFNLGFNLTNHNEKEIARDIAVDIPSGASSKHIAEILEDKGVIGSALMFRINSRMKGFDNKFKFGSYIMNSGMSEEEIMKILMTDGAKAKQVIITIPEGYSVYQIAKLLDTKGICKEQAFLDAANKTDYAYEFLKDLPSREEDNIALEGYLFPDTYYLSEDATAEQVVEKLLARFNEIFSAKYYAKAKDLGLTIDQAVTIASIIEREAKIPKERPLMSSVIYNRLNIDMRLQMCSTILYAQGRVGEPVKRLLFEDLEVESPYNTYKNIGLPVGPISNPGKAAIDAALYPPKTDYFYFTLINEETGEHHFSKTLSEHNANKGGN